MILIGVAIPLTHEGEVEIARRIERGKLWVTKAISRMATMVKAEAASGRRRQGDPRRCATHPVGDRAPRPPGEGQDSPADHGRGGAPQKRRQREVRALLRSRTEELELGARHQRRYGAPRSLQLAAAS